MIVTSDIFTAQYKDEATFVEAILGRLKIEAREMGWRGTALDWIEWRPADERRGPLCTITIREGKGDVTVADCRLALKTQRHREAA